MTAKLFISMFSVPYFDHRVIVQSLEPFIEGFHLDVMDDHFVGNLAFSPNMIQEIRNYTKKMIWLHLMVDNPEKWVQRATTILKNGDRITIHDEILATMSQNKQMEILYSFKQNDFNVGLALNPETTMPICQLLLPHIEHLLIMTVKPGFCGQLFINSMKEKIKTIVQYKKQENHSYRIAIDGGITKELYDELKTYPVNDFVLGSALFSNKKDPKQELQNFL